MKVEVLNKSKYQEYESFILSFDHALFYHSIKYKNFLENLLGCESHYLLAYDKHGIAAALPLMVRNGKLGRVVNSLPYYGSNGGIISNNNNAHKQLLGEYENFAKQKDVVSATMIENPLNKPEILPLHNSTDLRVGQFTNIQCDKDYEEEIFKKISGNRRNEVRRSKRNGIEVTEENDYMDFIRITHQEEMKKNNRKYKDDNFFSKIEGFFLKGVDYKIFIARHAGKPIAGLLMFYFNRIAEYFTPVILTDARTLQPMSLILYNALLDAMKRGYKLINWGGTWISQEGVYRFKKQMGAQDYPYNYYTQVNDFGIFQYSLADILSMYPNFYVFNFNKLGIAE